MQRKSRPADQKIFSNRMFVRLTLVGAVAAVFAILAYQWTINANGSTTSAQTMAMVMFSIIHIPISLSLRHPFDTAFRAETFSNKYLLMAYGWVLLTLVLVIEIGILQRIFDTKALTRQQWGICLAAVLLFFLVSEIIKLILRLVGLGKKEG